MEPLVLADLGGRFLTTAPRAVAAQTVPGVNAYVSWFRPARARDVSVTFVHGGGGQGSEFLTTPDGRPGWVHAFLQAGFPVFVLDRPGHGRSRWREAVLGPALPPPSYETLHPRFVEPARHGDWPEASRHAQWPDHDPLAGDRFMAGQGVMATTLAAAQRHVEAIAPDLFALTGPTVLVSHSAGGPCGWALAAIGGGAVAAILAVEPLGFPGLRHPLGTFADGLCAVAPAGRHDPYGCPIAILTGEASWMRAMNARSAAFLRERGCNVTHLRLEEHGLRGNGHMMMSEKNSDDVAALMISVLGRMLRPAPGGSSIGNKRVRSPDTEA